MEKLAYTAKTFAAAALTLAAVACSNGASTNAPAPAAPAETAGTARPLNIRYVDSDSLGAHYNLSIDFREAYMRALSKIDGARQSRGNEIQKFAAAIQEKAQSNGYLSEASYNADMQKLQKMQADAENYLNTLSRNADAELAQQQQQINDSIESFIRDYNATRHYDAILYKGSGIYFDPALDITGEIIEGLNARYNKVSTTK